MKIKLSSILKFLFSRLVIIGVLIALQALVLFLTIWQLSNDYVYVYGCFGLLSLLVTFGVINNDDSPEFKLAWVVPILLFPIFGGLFYLFFGRHKITKKELAKAKDIYLLSDPLLVQDEAIMDELKRENSATYRQARYLADYAGYPVFCNTSTHYLPLGEVKWSVMKEALSKAEHYIFLEYFIIEEGVMWQEILTILQEKAQQGLDVRVMYDDIGTVQLLPYKYDRQLENMGIKCQIFNPFRPRLDLKMNNRDHRKICVIDGHTAITGGINIADEYINVKVVHGHWKDVAVLLRGDAAWSLTVMFLQLWNFSRPQAEDQDFAVFKPQSNGGIQSDAFVQPFTDSPFDDERVGKNAYLQMLDHAVDYVYINTPYLIIDNEFVSALQLVAKSGVDVCIVTPHIGDKWYVHLMTRSFYEPLIEAGVKVYEYTPGFIHAKTFVSDDETAIIGTINLDYRSLYHHFEDGVWMYRSEAVMELKADFLQMLEICTEMTLADCQNVNVFNRFFRSLIRLFAPLM